MAMKCFNCGKGMSIGRTHRHHPGVAGGRWKQRAPEVSKTFKPNLHFARLLIGTNYRKVRLCTKCLRLMKKAKRTPDTRFKVEAIPAPAA